MKAIIKHRLSQTTSTSLNINEIYLVGGAQAIAAIAPEFMRQETDEMLGRNGSSPSQLEK